MLTVIMVATASILEGLYETLRDYIKAKAFAYKSYKMRPGHHVKLSTRIRYGFESVWDYIITPR